MNKFHKEQYRDDRLDRMCQEIQNAVDAAPLLIGDLLHVEEKFYPVGVLPPNMVQLYDRDDVKNFYKAAQMMGASTLADNSIDLIADKLQQQAYAARIIGANSIAAIGVVHRIGNSSFSLSTAFTCALDEDIKKSWHSPLRLASVAAYPMILDETERRQLTASGYSVERVARDAIAYNEFNNGYYIPVPLSYQNSNPYEPPQRAIY